MSMSCTLLFASPCLLFCLPDMIPRHLHSWRRLSLPQSADLVHLQSGLQHPGSPAEQYLGPQPCLKLQKCLAMWSVDVNLLYPGSTLSHQQTCLLTRKLACSGIQNLNSMHKSVARAAIMDARAINESTLTVCSLELFPLTPDFPRAKTMTW